MHPQDLKNILAQHTCSESLYRHAPFAMLYSEGVKAFADNAAAYWFLDILATQPELKKHDFIVVTLVSNPNKTGAINATDGNENCIYSRPLDFTNCPQGQWEFFIEAGVAILPSEH